MSLLSELRKRRVFSTAAIYVPAAWLVAEIVLAVFDRFGAPAWAGDVIVVLFLLGFPVALLLSWLFDVTASGVRRASPGTPLGVVTLLASGLFLSLATYVSYQVFSGRLESVRLAVLPLRANAADPDAQPLGYGVADALRSGLRELPAFNVPARTSSEAISQAGLDIAAIAARLGVEYVIEGSLELVGDSLNVSITLLDSDGEVMWSERFERVTRDVFALHNDLVRAVALQLGVGEFDPALQAQIRKPAPTQDSEAHRLYLRGKYAPVEDADFRNRLADLQEARARDPGYAAVYPAIASDYAMACWGMDDRQAPSCELAINFARQGLELDPSMAEALAVLAMVYSLRYEWKEAYAAIEEFNALPNSQILSPMLPSAYLNLGLAGQAWNSARDFYRNDPLNHFAPTLLTLWAWYLLEDQETADYYAAIHEELMPGPVMASWPEYRAHRVPLERAIEEGRQAAPVFDVPPEWADLIVPVVYDPSLAEEAASELDRWHDQGRIRTAQYWSWLPYVQRYDQFVEMAFEMYDQKILNPLWLWESVPGAEHIRAHPRFLELMEYIGIANFWDQHGWPDFCKLENDRRVCGAGPAAVVKDT